MITAIHVADLHLTTGPDRDYSLRVLDEIVALAVREKAELLLLCGDVFDNFAAVDALRAEFRACLARLPAACKTVYILGNHETHGAREERVGARDLGSVEVVEATDWAMALHAGVELLCIPHRRSYDGYRDWAVPAKQAPVRLVLAHGLVCEMGVYAGPEGADAEDAGVLDADLFAFHRVDYAALGHVHKFLQQRIGSTMCVYAGSARVFRRGESGPHGVLVLRIESDVRPEFCELACAGTYRCREFPVGLDGNVKGLEEWAQGWGTADSVEVKLLGFVEDENVLSEQLRRFERQYRPRVRELRVNRDGVEVLGGIAAHPLARKFVELWEQERPPEGGPDEALWLRARQIGLSELSRLVQKNA